MDEKQKPKRKTLDEWLGIKGLGLLAVLAMLILEGLADVAALTAIYQLIKRRNDPTLLKNEKIVGWVLVSIWFVMLLLIHAKDH